MEWRLAASYNLYIEFILSLLFTSYIYRRQYQQARTKVCNCSPFFFSHPFARQECSNVTADSTDDSESSSKNHSNHSSDQLGAAAAASMASQLEQASQQQLQHKVCIIPHDVLCVCVCAFVLLWSFLFAFSNSSIRFSCALLMDSVPYHGFMSLASPQKATTTEMLVYIYAATNKAISYILRSPIGRITHYSRAFMILLLPRSPIPTR